MSRVGRRRIRKARSRKEEKTVVRMQKTELDCFLLSTDSCILSSDFGDFLCAELSDISDNRRPRRSFMPGCRGSSTAATIRPGLPPSTRGRSMFAGPRGSWSISTACCASSRLSVRSGSVIPAGRHTASRRRSTPIRTVPAMSLLSTTASSRTTCSCANSLRQRGTPSAPKPIPRSSPT